MLASEWSTGRLGEVSRSCGCELLFGDGAVKDALDGGPGVSDGGWRIVCVFRAVADELLGVMSRAACGLQDERDKVDVWISVEFALLCSLGHVTWAGAGCCNEVWAAREWSDNGDIEVRGGTVLTKDKVHACMFHLAIHHTSEGWDGLLDVHLSAVV